MRETECAGKSVDKASAVTRPLAGPNLAGMPVRREKGACSPRASVAYSFLSAMDWVRRMLAAINPSLPESQIPGSAFPKLKALHPWRQLAGAGRNLSPLAQEVSPSRALRVLDDCKHDALPESRVATGQLPPKQ